MLKRLLVVLVGSLMLIVMLQPSAAKAQGYSVSCDDGTSFDNGVKVTIDQMRSGFTYRATAIGLNGFDPVLAVLDESTGDGLCTDDDNVAAGYSADLPSTGFVGRSDTSAQVRFDQTSSSAFADVSLVVGGYGNTSGEFLLVLEGMAVTSADGAGDPFSITIDQNMVDSGVNLTAYMISRSDTLDPLLYLVDSRYNPLDDGNGGVIGCDNAGFTKECWGVSENLSDSYVTVQDGKLGGYDYDSLINIPLDQSLVGTTANFLMTSYGQQTLGQYIVAFHMGVSEAGSTGVGSNSNVNPTAVPQQQTAGNQGNTTGASVDCADGGHFDNGVEVTVVQMRAGYTYTATAIGLNGFDPVLAVLGDNGNGICTDDDPVAAYYDVVLPSTGYVPTSDTSSQVRFSQDSGSGMANVSLVVGGYGNTSGEFVLILEGMAVTSADGPGDPFAITINQSMISSGVPLSVYMISRSNDLDPYIDGVDANGKELVDDHNRYVDCDDSGTTSCWGDSVDLSKYAITTRSGPLKGGSYDSMLFFPLDPSLDNLSFDLLMTSSGQQTLGQYMMVIHAGTSTTPISNPNADLQPNV